MLTVCGVLWQYTGVSSPQVEPMHVAFHRPDGTLRAPLYGLQGGGVFVDSTEWLTLKAVTSMTTPLLMCACIFEPFPELSSIAPLEC